MDLDLKSMTDQFYTYLLVFVRITSMSVAAPVLGSGALHVPPQLMAGLGGALSLLVMMNLPIPDLPPDLSWGFALMLAGEVFMGISLGFVITILIAGLQFGGEVIDHLVGFAVVTVIDPVTNESASIIGNFKSLLATVLFLLFDGHHHLYRGLVKSFEVVPPGGVGLRPEVWPLLSSYGDAMFVVGIQVAAPALLVMTLLYVPEGFLARMVPQLNLMINDVPLRIGLGLVVVWLGLGPFVHLAERVIEQMGQATEALTFLMAGT